MTNTLIGVVAAAGDLGGQICVQLVAANHQVLAFARDPKAQINTIKGIDLTTTVRSVNAKVRRVTIDDLLDQSGVVHWCAPLSALDVVKTFRTGQTIVLHDSVMRRSLEAKEAIQARLPRAKVAIVHCLMNVERMVVVAKGHDDGDIAKHFKQLGMRVKTLSVQEHDHLMAHSQAPLAMLCAVLLDDLDNHAADGLLTNSGHALHMALKDRSAQWTPATLDAILSNPELPTLIARLQSLLKR